MAPLSAPCHAGDTLSTHPDQPRRQKRQRGLGSRGSQYTAGLPCSFGIALRVMAQHRNSTQSGCHQPARGNRRGSCSAYLRSGARPAPRVRGHRRPPGARVPRSLPRSPPHDRAHAPGAPAPRRPAHPPVPLGDGAGHDRRGRGPRPEGAPGAHPNRVHASYARRATTCSRSCKRSSTRSALR